MTPEQKKIIQVIPFKCLEGTEYEQLANWEKVGEAIDALLKDSEELEMVKFSYNSLVNIHGERVKELETCEQELSRIKNISVEKWEELVANHLGDRGLSCKYCGMGRHRLIKVANSIISKINGG